jgi:BirA family biotin operon repressor/biotin-[acetyl-CoA-carboxylase] ligase
MSVLVFPPQALAAPGWLTALGAVAVAELSEELTGQRAGIKWPNDVRIAGRKLAGVLVERGAGAVVGIGLNINATADDFPAPLRDTATSLRVLVGEPLDRSEVARRLIERLDAHYTLGCDAGPGPLDDAWRQRLEWLGAPVVAETPSGAHRGVLTDASLVGGLLLATPEGDTVRLAGSVVRTLAPEPPEADLPGGFRPR